MSTPATDKAFTGSIPACYERYLVPLMFEPYAIEMAERIRALSPHDVLEIACGTGVLTRRLAKVLEPDCTIIATDLNQPMLDVARATGTKRPVQWSQADAMQLPFDDASVDVVACQFGVMFFPDKPTAFAEARRVLRRGGTFIFNAWDRLEENVLAQMATDAIAAIFPDNPSHFMRRTPHGYYDADAIARDLLAAGFDVPARIDLVAARSRAANAMDVAMAYCQGTPMWGEILARQADGLDAVTERVAAHIASIVGTGPIDEKMQALVCSVVR